MCTLDPVESLKSKEDAYAVPRMRAQLLQPPRPVPSPVARIRITLYKRCCNPRSIGRVVIGSYSACGPELFGARLSRTPKMTRTCSVTDYEMCNCPTSQCWRCGSLYTILFLLKTRRVSKALAVRRPFERPRSRQLSHLAKRSWARNNAAII